MKVFSIAVIVVLALTSGGEQQQERPEALRVRVVDPEMQEIQGASVHVLRLGSESAAAPRQSPVARKSREQVAYEATDQDGRAVFSSLGFGRYDIHVSLDGFQPVELVAIPMSAEDVRYIRVPEQLVVLNPIYMD